MGLNKLSRICLLGLFMGLSVAPCAAQGPEADPITQAINRFPVKKITVRNSEFSYVDQGKGEVVVLLHGYLHDYRV